MEAPRGGAGLSTRSRELGIRFGDAPPGAQDAITDVAGVRVGSVTLVEGEEVRTGVTAYGLEPERLLEAMGRYGSG